MTSKAARARAKRARSALQAVCAVSGVVIAAAPKKGRQRASSGSYEPVADVLAPMLTARLRVMGWPDTEANRKLARDQRLATLYGRLHAAKRIDSDAYLGIEAAEKLDGMYRREVLGAPVGGDGLGAGIDQDPAHIRALTNRWMALQGVLGGMGATRRELVLMTISAPLDASPAAVTDDHARAVEIGGHELARHFGLRL